MRVEFGKSRFNNGSTLASVLCASAMTAAANTAKTMVTRIRFTTGYVAIFAVGCGLIGAAPASAQSVHDRLAGAKTIDCKFTAEAVAIWKNGDPQVEMKTSALVMRFESINTDEGTARVVGMFGPSDIIVRLSEDTLHLVQSFREGPLYATTVFPKETRGGRFQAVHSRHEWTSVALPGYTSSPEQYYGDCQVSP